MREEAAIAKLTTDNESLTRHLNELHEAAEAHPEDQVSELARLHKEVSDLEAAVSAANVEKSTLEHDALVALKKQSRLGDSMDEARDELAQAKKELVALAPRLKTRGTPTHGTPPCMHHHGRSSRMSSRRSSRR